jgi:polar amino acid transport system substrate-binding protein
MAAEGDEPPASGPGSLAGLLRGLRQRALLTQEELALRSGLSVRTIRGLELGRIRRPHSGSLRRLADALQLAGQEREALVAAAHAERADPTGRGPDPTPAVAAPPASGPPPQPRVAAAAGLVRLLPRWVWSVALLAVLAVLLSQLVATDPDPDAGTAAPSTAPPPSTAGSGLQPLPERIRAAGRIVVSSQDALAPIVFVEPGGRRFRGLDHDLAQAMGERLQVEFQFREVDFTHSFRELREGRSDIAMSVFRDVNPEPDLDYVHYLHPGTAFLVPKGNPLGIRSRDDLCGRTVARPLTTPAEALARQSRRCVARGAARITLVTCPTVPDPRAPVRGQLLERRCPAGPEPLRRVQELVADRRVDAAMLDLPLAEHAMRAPGAVRDLEIARPGVDAGPYGIVFRKADRQLGDAVRSALGAIVADGTYARILARWGLGGLALPSAGAAPAGTAPTIG